MRGLEHFSREIFVKELRRMCAAFKLIGLDLAVACKLIVVKAEEEVFRDIVGCGVGPGTTIG